MVGAPDASPVSSENAENIDQTQFSYDMRMTSRTLVALCQQDGAVVNDQLNWFLYDKLSFSTLR